MILTKIRAKELKVLIEPHFHDMLEDSTYNVVNSNARELLTFNRLDLAFKLLYLEGLNCKSKFSESVYDEHINAFGLGKVSEYGNENKRSLEDFKFSFNTTFESISLKGFDEKTSIIPLSLSGSIANGAHRLASLIYLNKNLKTVKLDVEDHIYDYNFFYERNMSESSLDAGVTTFVEYADNVYIACVWPSAIGNDKELEHIIPNIVYKKKIAFNYNGAHNLITKIYDGESWLGERKENFKGASGKVVECFKNFGNCRIYAFQCESLREVLKIKEKVRKLFGIEKHSIHITDNKEESIRVARLVFNENAIHFLNNARPNKIEETYEKLEYYKKFLSKNKILTKDIVLDSSFLLSLYGIRKAKDIDYLLLDGKEVSCSASGVESHDSELSYHNEEKVDLITNPKFHFYFDGIKFISFEQLYRMKLNRAEEKDSNDISLMEGILSEDFFKIKFSKFKQNLYYLRLRMRIKLIDTIRFLGLYKIIRNLYRLVLKK